MTPRHSVELFHLLFLRGLFARLEDKTLVALKGGCNLRFYFGSVRYSEDIDLDVSKVAKPTLQKKVDQLLASPLIRSPLAAQGLAIVEVTSPKQTETAQRWKLGVRVPGQIVRTKIEFARRGAIEGARYETISQSFASAHALAPFLATHYPVDRAIIQKIHALSDRKQPQARDLFDLNHLFPLSSAELRLVPAEAVWVGAAIENAMSISYGNFLAQVVAYLDPDEAVLYADRHAFELLQSTVVDRLEALA